MASSATRRSIQTLRDASNKTRKDTNNPGSESLLKRKSTVKTEDPSMESRQDTNNPVPDAPMTRRSTVKAEDPSTKLRLASSITVPEDSPSPEKQAPVITAMSSAAEVRAYLARKRKDEENSKVAPAALTAPVLGRSTSSGQAEPKESEYQTGASALVPAVSSGGGLRHEDPVTGSLTIYSSMDELLSWIPQMDYDKLAAWAQMPIFRIRLFSDRRSYEMKHVSYVDHIFPRGEDLASSICWWRKRMSQACRGFAVFEGGFDVTGPVNRTDPPVVWIDAETGEVGADDFNEIARKRRLHLNLLEMDKKFAAKGHSAETLQKIAAAEALVREKKQRGQEYFLTAGWVSPVELAAQKTGRNALALDTVRHNDLYKRYANVKYAAPFQATAAAIVDST